MKVYKLSHPDYTDYYSSKMKAYVAAVAHMDSEELEYEIDKSDNFTYFQTGSWTRDITIETIYVL